VPAELGAGSRRKSPIGPNYRRDEAQGCYCVEDFNGRSHAYPPPA
jgi:hypothetical protein